MLFKDWSEADFSDLNNFCLDKNLAAGEILFYEGEEADCFYILNNGSISIRKTTQQGDEEALMTLNTGAVFGELSLLHRVDAIEKRSASATALETTTVIQVPYVPFEKILHRSAEASLQFYKNMAVHLAVQIRQTTEDVTGLRALKLRHF